jgi:transglutaminase-like putative cysteine protease
MLANILLHIWNRYRPSEGWLSLFLLSGAVLTLTTALVAVEWVPEISIVHLSGILGLLLSTLLAKRPLRPIPAWLLITGYGLVTAIIGLGDLLPPFAVLLRGESGAFFRQQWALLFDRLAGWYLAVAAGESSRETLPFALTLALLVWFLAAYAGWSTYRRHRPLLAIVGLGLALALNGYYGGDDAPVWLFAFFIGFGAMLVAVMHFAIMEHDWLARGIDYSGEIRLELLATAGGVALVLSMLALSLPALRISTIARAFQQSEPVQEAEVVMERAFAGVRQPRREPIAFVGQTSGVMPRSYLLGNPPELYETQVMTATVTPAAVATHLRALSYDVYTGRGWALSQDRSEPLPAGQPLPALATATVTRTTHTVFTQTIQLVEQSSFRYTAGQPLQFDQDVTVYWRGQDDFVRANGSGSTYSAISRLTTAPPQLLRTASLQDIPPALFARYTQLPDNFPQSVRELAHDVAAEQPTPFDQARALQTFLRQYPYSLDVPSPPGDVDPVEFFLFDLQTGYCDYYASAMVVMARSLGLPARLATGYLAQTPDENGAQTIYQINAHAWAEIYFAGIGWVEFEPTAPFPLSGDVAPAPEEDSPGFAIPEAPPAPPPIPEQAPPLRLWPWLVLFLVPPLLLFIIWQRRRSAAPTGSEALPWAYDRLQRSARRLGLPTPRGQTPAEFQASFLALLSGWNDRPWLSAVPHTVQRLTDLYIIRQYSNHPLSITVIRQVRQAWQRAEKRLWLLAFLKNYVSRRD